MINKRLLELVQGSKQITAINVVSQWIGLVSNVMLMGVIARALSQLINRETIVFNQPLIIGTLILIAIRYFCLIYSTKQSYKIANKVKQTLRLKIVEKLEKIDISKHASLTTADIIQLSTEGVEQLEVYFGNYLPQLVFSVLAPITLFIVFAKLNLTIATVMVFLVVLIPISIVLVMKIAKKILSKYWSKYTALGNSFLENLQGMTTLKIYEADHDKRIQMQIEAEDFRKVTMKVLMMQLNSITVMDMVTYGGYALAVIMALNSLSNHQLGIEQTLFIMLIGLDFFTPMRRLGSYFHIAMNGMAASDKIFKLLDEKEKDIKTKQIVSTINQTKVNNLSFAYQSDPILKKISMEFNRNELCAIVGQSGSGKSTLTKLLINKLSTKEGSINLDNIEINEVSHLALNQRITLLNHQSYLFSLSVRENLLMGKPTATDKELWDVLQAVEMDEDLQNLDGLETVVKQGASNFSIGQRQRIAFARAMLKDSDIYIFDEVTANIDQKSEELMMKAIYKLALTKQVIVIAHHLSTIKEANKIYVMNQGEIIETGNHDQLIAKQGNYKMMWETQQAQRQVNKRSIR